MRRTTLMLALAAAWPIQLYAADEATQDADTLPEIKVSAGAEPIAEPPSEDTQSYTVRSSASATRLDTSLRDTPQSISVVTRQLMDDFRLTNINDVLDYTTGVRVERSETERTYYTARGSDITNFQYDGLGVPFADGLQIGDIDVAVFDRIEILRGANGLLTGTGNPSATINFVRKRPTADFQARVDASVGSWNTRRLDVDVSGPLNAAGNVRGRLVLANQNKDAYLDRYSQERNVAYGIIEADISDSTQIAFGHTYQQNDTNSPMWGALPLFYADGTVRPHQRSDSSGGSWAYWNNLTNITFAELTHYFDNGWKLKGQLTRREQDGDSKLLYVFGAEDRATGDGLSGWPGQYRDTYKELIADVYASGPFRFAGRTHEAVVGVNWSRSTYDEHEKSAPYGFAPVTFAGIPDFPEPAWVPGDFGSFDIKRINTYGALKLNVADPLKLTIGANVLSYEYTGISYGAERAAKANDKVTPYIGAVFALDDVHSLYASYTGIYNPQTKQDATRTPLDPLQGKNYEAGLKSEWLGKRLNTSFAVFRNEQENFGQAAANQPVPGFTIYEGIDFTTKGYEFDVSGEVTDRLKVSGGFTHLVSVENKDGENVKPYTPRRMLRLSAVYRVPMVEKLSVGGNVSWQDDIHSEGTPRISQGSFAVVNAMASYAFNQHWSAALNIYNLTDKKYYNSFMWDQAYYAAPRNAMATLTWRY